MVAPILILVGIALMMFGLSSSVVQEQLGAVLQFNNSTGNNAGILPGAGSIDLSQKFVEMGVSVSEIQKLCSSYGGTFANSPSMVGCKNVLLPIVPCNTAQIQVASSECVKAGGKPVCNSNNVYCIVQARQEVTTAIQG